MTRERDIAVRPIAEVVEKWNHIDKLGDTEGLLHKTRRVLNSTEDCTQITKQHLGERFWINCSHNRSGTQRYHQAEQGGRYVCKLWKRTLAMVNDPEK